MTKHIRITAQEIADAIGEPVICADYEDGTTAHELLLETQRARAKNHAQALEAVISMLEYTIAREWGAGLFVVHGNYEAPLTRALQELRKAQKEFESFYRNGADR